MSSCNNEKIDQFAQKNHLTLSLNYYIMSSMDKYTRKSINLYFKERTT